jgi:hypothetical protein
VLGVILFLASKIGRSLKPLAAMDAMTLSLYSLYSLHLLALAPDLHYDQPGLWFLLQLAVAAAFAWFWTQYLGRGPLEMVVVRAVAGVRSMVAGGTSGAHHDRPSKEASDHPGSARH